MLIAFWSCFCASRLVPLTLTRRRRRLPVVGSGGSSTATRQLRLERFSIEPSPQLRLVMRVARLLALEPVGEPVAGDPDPTAHAEGRQLALCQQFVGQVARDAQQSCELGDRQVFVVVYLCLLEARVLREVEQLRVVGLPAVIGGPVPGSISVAIALPRRGGAIIAVTDTGIGVLPPCLRRAGVGAPSVGLVDWALSGLVGPRRILPKGLAA